MTVPIPGVDHSGVLAMQILVVGGEHAFVHGTFAMRLGEVGVNIGAHWDWAVRRPPQVVPKGCKGVVVLHDMVGHHLSNAAKDAASSAGVPFALVPRKFSAALPVLQKAGIVSMTAVTTAMDSDSVVEVKPINSDLSDRRAWIALMIEGNITASDEEITRMTSEYIPGSDLSDVLREVPVVRSDLRAQWSATRRTDEAEKSLRGAAKAWLTRKAPDVDDPKSIQTVRTEAHTLFGTTLPLPVWVDAGFQVWEVRGFITRERIRTCVAAGVAMYGALTTSEIRQLRTWLETAEVLKTPMSTYPLNMTFRGRPMEAMVLFLLCYPQLTMAAAQRAYLAATGSGLGPYYYEAMTWALSKGYMPSPITVQVVAEIKPAKAVPPAVVDNGIVMETEPIPVTTHVGNVAMAEMLPIYEAVMAAAASLAAGGDTSGLDKMVRGMAAKIIEQQELESAESELKAAEALFKAAEAKAVATRARLAALRG